VTPRVVVIGGGLAGMAAALGCAEGGLEVTLVERRSRLGGLTWSFRRQGVWFDNGQHVFLRCCTAYRSFLERIGAADQVHLQPRLEVPVLAPGGRRSTISRSGAPAPFHLGASLMRYRHISVPDRLRLGRAVLALRRLDLDDPGLDRRTFGAWLSAHGQSGRAVANLWNLIVLPTLNIDAGEASLALAATVFRTGLLDTNDGGDIGWSAVPLDELHGANGARALGMAGVSLRLGAKVERLSERDGQWSVDVGGETVRADAVVVAASPATTASLVPELAPAVEHLGSSPIVNVHLVLDRRVTDLPMAAGVGSPVQFVFDRTVSSGVQRGQVLAVSLSGADRVIGWRPETLVRSFHDALGELFPRAATATLVDATVTREHAATFRAGPGSAAWRPTSATARPGLLLAGAWCHTGWPATMEGAVLSGRAAADEALGRLGGVATMAEVR
jgi:squalene-associated FAD-dependent desaturase